MKLQEHQRRVVDTDDNKIVYHSLGSGKTLTGLSAIARAQKESDKDALFIVPAPLINNIYKEIDKHNIDIDRNRLDVITYDKAVRNIEALSNKARSIVVLDEAHRVRNTNTKRYQAIREISKDSDRRLYLTGTPIYSEPSDIGVLINSVSGERILPNDKSGFLREYTKETTIKPTLYDKIINGKTDSVEVSLKNSRRLGHILNQYVDKYQVSTGDEFFPTKIDKTIKVEMGKEHEAVYNYAEDAIPGDLKKKVRSGAALSRADMVKLQSFLTGPRLAALGTSYIDKDSDVSSKLDAAVDSLMSSHLDDTNFKGVVYSNFISAGLEPYRDRLVDRGVGSKVQMFTGKMNNAQRKDAIDNYNSGAKPILLVSSAGTEGLDLKGTKKIQILEPHFHEEKINQIIGRGARYHSHTHLPKDEQKVDIEHYLSVRSPGILGRIRGETVDEFLHKRYAKKRELDDQIRDLMASPE